MQTISKIMLGFLVAITVFQSDSALAVGKESLLSSVTAVNGALYKASLRFYKGGKHFIRQVGLEVPARCVSGKTDVIRFQPFEIATFLELSKGRTAYQDTLLDVPDGDIFNFSTRTIRFQYENATLSAQAIRKTQSDSCEGSITFKFTSKRDLKDAVYHGYGSDNLDEWYANVTLDANKNPQIFQITGGISAPIIGKPGYYEGRVVSCASGYSRVTQQMATKRSFLLIIDDGTELEGFQQRCTVQATYNPKRDSFLAKVTFDYLDSSFVGTKTVKIRLRRGK